MNDSNDLPSADSDPSDLAGSLSILQVPEPVQKGFFKAVSQIAGAATDIGAAWLESHADNIRSRTDARRLLRTETARSIAEAFGTDSAIANRAFARHASTILGEQINVEDILVVAAEQLEKDGTRFQPETEPTDDFMNGFLNEAKQKSSEEMKLAFGRILAGEIQQPGSFSLRTVRSLSVMPTDAAVLFKRACAMCVSIEADRSIIDVRIPSLGKNVGENALSTFGLTFDGLNILSENDLILSNYETRWKLGNVLGILTPKYAGKYLNLTAQDEFNSDFWLHGVALSSVGKQLYRVVDIEENTKFTSALFGYLKNQKLIASFAS